MSSYEFYLSDVTFTNGSAVAQINNADSVFGVLPNSLVFIEGASLPYRLLEANNTQREFLLNRPWTFADSESLEVHIIHIAAISQVNEAITANTEAFNSFQDVIKNAPKAFRSIQSVFEDGTSWSENDSVMSLDGFGLDVVNNSAEKSNLSGVNLASKAMAGRRPTRYVFLEGATDYNENIADANSARLSSVITASNDGDLIQVTPIKGRIPLHPVGDFEKAVLIDWGDNDFIVDLSLNNDEQYVSETTDFMSSSIRPLVSLKGAIESWAVANPIPKGSIVVDVSPEIYGELMPGDIIYVTSNDSIPFWNPYFPGTHNVGELTIVEKKLSDGISLELGTRTRFSYADNITIQRLNSKALAGMVNGRFIEKSYSARYGGYVGDAWAPCLFRLENLINPVVKNQRYDNVNITAAVISGCWHPIISNNRLYNAQQKSQGGHGILVKFQERYSELAEVVFNKTIRSRHLCDWVKAHNSYSAFNTGFKDEGTYTWHGLGSTHCYSINDRSYDASPNGWGAGRTKFAADSDVKIINPIGSGTRRLLGISGDTRGVLVTGGDFTVDGIGSDAYPALIWEQPREVTIENCKFRIVGGNVSNNLITIRKYFGNNDDPDGLITGTPQDVDIINNTFYLYGSRTAIRAQDVTGRLDTRNNRYVVQDESSCVGLFLANTISPNTKVYSIMNSPLAGIGSIESFSIDDGMEADFVYYELDSNGNVLTNSNIKSEGNIEASGEVCVNGNVGDYKPLAFKTEGLNRFIMRVDNTEELGNNTGSDFEFITRNDDGSFNKAVFRVNRKSGQMEYVQEAIYQNSANYNEDIFAKKNVNIEGRILQHENDIEPNEFHALIKALNGLVCTGNLSVDNVAGVTKSLVFSTEGVSSWIFRERTDGDLEIVSRDANGDPKDLIMRFYKDSGVVKFLKPPQIQAAHLQTYVVANLPPALTSEDQVVICNDGDAGNKCLAISDGVQWRRIPLGIEVSEV